MCNICGSALNTRWPPCLHYMWQSCSGANIELPCLEDLIYACWGKGWSVDNTKTLGCGPTPEKFKGDGADLSCRGPGTEEASGQCLTDWAPQRAHSAACLPQTQPAYMPQTLFTAWQIFACHTVLQVVMQSMQWGRAVRQSFLCFGAFTAWQSNQVPSACW